MCCEGPQWWFHHVLSGKKEDAEAIEKEAKEKHEQAWEGMFEQNKKDTYKDLTMY